MAHAFDNAFTRRHLLTGATAVAAVAAVALFPASAQHFNSKSLAQVASPEASPGARPQASPTGGEVNVHFTQQLTFDPETIIVKVGTTVIWDNRSTGLHTVTCNPGKATSPETAAMISLPEGAEPWASELLYPGDHFSHTFTTVGTYDYICVPHIAVGMHGQIIVE